MPPGSRFRTDVRVYTYYEIKHSNPVLYHDTGWLQCPTSLGSGNLFSGSGDFVNTNDSHTTQYNAPTCQLVSGSWVPVGGSCYLLGTDEPIRFTTVVDYRVVDP